MSPAWLSVPPSWGLDGPPGNPLELFADWMGRADSAGVTYPTAVTLSTASPDGVVSARTVILKGYDLGCLLFESETYSRKGTELAANPRVAMTLYWREVHRQICVTGTAAPMEPSKSDEMWERRARPNQAATVASREGETLEAPEEELALNARADEIAGSSGPIPRPTTYVAYGLLPLTVEFWEGSADRLHRRLFYERAATDADWSKRRIQP